MRTINDMVRYLKSLRDTRATRVRIVGYTTDPKTVKEVAEFFIVAKGGYNAAFTAQDKPTSWLRSALFPFTQLPEVEYTVTEHKSIAKTS